MSALKTAVLLGALTGLLVGLGYIIGGPDFALIALIFAGVMNFVAYWFSDKLALRMAGAKEVSREAGARAARDRRRGRDPGRRAEAARSTSSRTSRRTLSRRAATRSTPSSP